MAHQIETHTTPNGDVAFAAFGKTPAWHHLGKVFDDDMDVNDALAAAHLAGWDVRLARPSITECTNKAEVELLNAEPQYTTIHSKAFSTIRTNPINGGIDELGVGRGKGYTIVQNEELADFLVALVGQGARLASAGSLRHGTQVFFSLELPGDIYVGGFDQVKTYLTILNSHDGSTSVRAVASPIRVVCANTQEAALATAQSTWSHRHTKGVTASVAAAQHDLDLTFRHANVFGVQAERMLNEPFSLPEFDRFSVELFGSPDEEGLGKRGVTIRKNKIEGARAIWLNGSATADGRNTMDGIEGTRWGAYQAVTEFLDHASTGKPEVRALRSVDGESKNTRQSAFDLLSV